MRRYSLTIAVTFVVSLALGASAAQAVVVNMSALGKASVAYNPSDQSGYVGVELVPGTRSSLATAGIPTVKSNAPCTDPALASDLVLQSTGLCSHGGAVMNGNETFALTWDPLRRYWQTTRNYVEQFLSDVAGASGTLSSPYAVVPQYTDAFGRAGNASVYGGGCIDYGVVGGSACKFGDASGNGPGNNYLANGCPVTGTNDTCLTDAQLQTELKTMVAQTGMLDRTKSGYTPLVVLLTPQNVQICLNGTTKLCSANSDATKVPAQFCSYHSNISVPNGTGGTTKVSYVVQPWTAQTACDEPNSPPMDTNPATSVGARLVSPLSAGQLAAIVNPEMNGWFALDGSEIDDNGCQPLGKLSDGVTVGASGQNPYLLQREFNNAGAIESDPNAAACSATVGLTPAFVIPSVVNHGDVVQFDGSTSASTLMVPKAGYTWDFGDGTTGTGPSVVHTYANGGTYSVKLTVTDRGGNVATLGQAIVVEGPAPPPVSPPPPPAPRLLAHLQLLPQSLTSMLRAGVAVRVTSNDTADGIATLSISRSAARRAHIPTGRGLDVVIGRGTVSGIKNGTMELHLRLPSATATKLRRLGHVTLSVRLALVASSHLRLAIVAAGSY